MTADLSALLVLIQRIRIDAYSTALPPAEALGRIRDKLAEYNDTTEEEEGTA